jgi:hypothetical protein
MKMIAVLIAKKVQKQKQLVLSKKQMVEKKEVKDQKVEHLLSVVFQVQDQAVPVEESQRAVELVEQDNN